MHRIFNGKIKEAERVSLNTKKFILFYIEEDLSTEEGIAPSVETVGYKRAFSDTALSWLINNKVRNHIAHTDYFAFAIMAYL